MTAPPAPPAADPPGSSASPGGTVLDQAAGGSWSQAVATFTKSDGSTVEVRAETVRYCISAGTGVSLDEKTGSFERLRQAARPDFCQVSAQLGFVDRLERVA